MLRSDLEGFLGVRVDGVAMEEAGFDSATASVMVKEQRRFELPPALPFLREDFFLLEVDGTAGGSIVCSSEGPDVLFNVSYSRLFSCSYIIPSA